MMFDMLEKLPSTPEVSEWIDCSWTIYVIEPASELPLELGVRPDLPQLTVRGLDPSLVSDAYTILLGKTEFDVVREYQDNPAAMEDRARRVAEGVLIPNELTVQVLAFTDKVCSSLASMDEQRIVDMASRWQFLLFPSLKQHGSEPGASPVQQLRESVLRQLAHLAREAVGSGRKLMCRIEFRRCTKDPVTGRVHKIEATRH
jgi:hypothetical protein